MARELLGEWLLPHVKETLECWVEIAAGDKPTPVSLACYWPEQPPHPSDLAYYQKSIAPQIQARLEARLKVKGLWVDVD